jgi:hypothetical protein
MFHRLEQTIQPSGIINSSIPGLFISAGGPAQTWNYSSGWILSDTSFNIVLNPAGLPQSNLYPNPASGLLHFTKSSPLVSKMELVNLSGKVVFSYAMNDLPTDFIPGVC